MIRAFPVAILLFAASNAVFAEGGDNPFQTVTIESFDSSPAWTIQRTRNTPPVAYIAYTTSGFPPESGATKGMAIHFNSNDPEGIRIYMDHPPFLKGCPVSLTFYLRREKGGGELFVDFLKQSGRILRIGTGVRPETGWKAVRIAIPPVAARSPTIHPDRSGITFLGFYLVPPQHRAVQIEIRMIRVELRPCFLVPIPEFPLR